MKNNSIKAIFYVTGLITMTPVLQFFLPEKILLLSGLVMTDSVGLAFAQHWGLVVFCVGALLVYAANHPEIRRPIAIAAGVEKLGMVGMVLNQWTNPQLNGLHLAMFIDIVSVLLYAAYLSKGNETPDKPSN